MIMQEKIKKKSFYHHKANVIKTTDGKFLNICKDIGKDIQSITDEWYIDITTAKLIDEKRRTDFKVLFCQTFMVTLLPTKLQSFKVVLVLPAVQILVSVMLCLKRFTALHLV